MTKKKATPEVLPEEELMPEEPEFEPVNILELLEQLDKDVVVKIGAVNGSSFFYINDVKRTLLDVEAITGMLKLMRVKLRASARERFSSDKRNLVDALLFSAEVFNKKTIANAYEKFVNSGNYMLNAEEKYNKYVPFPDRLVMKFYDSITEPDTKIVLVQGYEVGKFWTLEEFKAKHGRRLKGYGSKEEHGSDVD